MVSITKVEHIIVDDLNLNPNCRSALVDNASGWLEIMILSNILPIVYYLVLLPGNCHYCKHPP